MSGRAVTRGRLFDTRCYEGILSFDQAVGEDRGSTCLQDLLCCDAELVDAPHEAETFWLPSDTDPTTPLEKIAKSIFDFHTKNLTQQKIGTTTELSPPSGRQQRSPRATRADPDNGNASDDCARSIGHKRPRDSRASCEHRVQGEGFSAEGAEMESGAEWWIQIREEGRHSNLGMPFHWDKDERLFEQKGQIVCPEVSTVTYLTRHGAPTVVLESRATDDGAVVEGDVERAFVSYPALYKHLAFDGSYLHGVPEILRRESSSTSESIDQVAGNRDHHNAQGSVAFKHDGSNSRPRGRMRVTLLVNVWLSHKPIGIARLPTGVAATLNIGLELPSLCFDRPIKFSPVLFDKETTHFETPALACVEGSIVVVKSPLGPTSLVEIRVPTREALSTDSRLDLHAFALLYEKGCCPRVVLDGRETDIGLPGEKCRRNRDRCK